MQVIYTREEVKAYTNVIQKILMLVNGPSPYPNYMQKMEAAIRDDQLMELFAEDALTAIVDDKLVMTIPPEYVIRFFTLVDENFAEVTYLFGIAKNLFALCKNLTTRMGGKFMELAQDFTIELQEDSMYKHQMKQDMETAAEWEAECETNDREFENRAAEEAAQARLKEEAPPAFPFPKEEAA